MSVDLKDGWRFSPDPDNAGLARQWAAPDFADAGWASVSTGLRWEDQGFPAVDGVGWYRRQVEIPASWQGGPVWFTAGAVNDACRVFCNGVEVGAFGDESEGGTSFSSIPFAADLTPHVRFGADNVLAVRVVDWGGSGGILGRWCRVTSDPSELQVPVFNGGTNLSDEKFTLSVNTVGLGSARPAATLVAEVPGAAPVREPLPAGTWTATVTVPVPGLRYGRTYEVRASLQDVHGKVIGAPAAPFKATLDLPAWPGKYSKLKVLNSLVTELLRVELSGEGRQGFLNPRDGWVYVGLTPKAGGATPEVRVAGRAEPLAFRANPDDGRLEAMLVLPEGEHALEVAGGEGWRLDVRAVPELAYCYYLANPHIAPYGPYDKTFLERHVMPHVNTLVSSGLPPEEDIRQWAREGRRWVANAPLPGLSDKDAPAAEAVYRTWIEAAGMDRPEYGGLIVDEFITASPAHYSAWSEAVGKVYDDPRFAGKTFYAFCGDLYEDAHSLDFAKGLMARGGLFALERYLCEEPSEDVARSWMTGELQHSLGEWQAALPGVEKRLVYVLGFMSGPPESLDTLPNVDYNVLQELQFDLLANDAAFFGLYGIMEYSASYADEESLRWACRLMRHYGIEGRRERPTRDPYLLAHVENGDFEGLKGWSVESAGEGALSTKTMDGLSWLQGRYPRTAQGDTYLSMERRAGANNRVRQALKGLERGRAYSLKLFAFAPRELGAQREAPLKVSIEGAAIDEALSFHCPYPSNYAHTLGAYDRENPAYFTFYRLVFRPGDGPVELVLSDEDRPVGSEVGVNFVQVQPYHRP